MSRRRGSILAGVLAVLAMLSILLAALHQYRGLNRVGLERQEALLDSEVALRWWEGGWLERAPAPPPLRVTARGSENELLKAAEAELRKPWGAFIYEREKLPDLAARPAEELQTGQRSANLKLRGATQEFPLRLTASAFFPYAACAPQGRVEIGQLKSWANPRRRDEKQPGAAGGGVPARVYAGTQATVDSLEYGEIDLGASQGQIRVKSGQFLARRGVAVPRVAGETQGDQKPAAAALLAQLEEAVARLTRVNRASGDKTSTVFPKVGTGEFIDWVAADFRRRMGGDRGVEQWHRFRETFYTLNTATNYPFFTIITGELELPDFTIALQPPMLPDVHGIGKQLYEEPRTRNQELAYIREDVMSQEGLKGIVYWSYIHDLGKIKDAVVRFVEGVRERKSPEAIVGAVAEALATAVRVYHFGDEDQVPKFAITTEPRRSLTARTTLTVPRGRSFFLDADLTLEGDLWIQRGASLQVTGGLTTVDPFPGQPFDTRPRGRIVLEQGATLVVGGQLVVAGTAATGSVLVTSEDGRVEGITSAILVGGSATFEHGILPGITYEDLCGGVGREDPGAQRLQKDFFEGYFDYFAPNQAKSRGPFFARLPWFADLSTEVSVTFVGLIPVPLINPIRDLNDPNLNCIFFRVGSVLETGYLNAVFGEFMAPMSRFWAFGRENVPALIKVSAADPLFKNRFQRLGRDMGSVVLPRPDEWGRQDFYQNQAQAVSALLDSAPQKLLPEVIARAVIQYSFIPVTNPPLRNTLIRSFLTQVDDAYKNLDKLSLDFERGYITRGLVPVKWLAPELVGMIRRIDQNEKAFSSEMPGVLVYAGENLRIAPTNLAVGMFVSRGNVDCQAERLVGSAFSLEKDVQCRSLWAYPGFTRASLTLPKDLASVGNPFALVRNTDYGKYLFTPVQRRPGSFLKPDALLVGGTGNLRLTSELVPGAAPSP